MSKSASRARLAEIIRKRSFGRGEITLASGRKSDFYFNLKPTMLDPEGAALLAELSFEALKAGAIYRWTRALSRADVSPSTATLAVPAVAGTTRGKCGCGSASFRARG